MKWLGVNEKRILLLAVMAVMFFELLVAAGQGIALGKMSQMSKGR